MSSLALDPTNFANEDHRWAALTTRDRAADRTFVYGVRTTKIFCRPICKARLARRANVVFFTQSHEAKTAGYRPCKRCKPDLSDAMPEEDAERKVRDVISRLGRGEVVACPLTVDAMAKQVGLSKWHFHRVFRRIAGVPPGEYIKSTAFEQSQPEEMDALLMADFESLFGCDLLH